MLPEDRLISSETRGWHDLGNSSELKSAELVAGMQAVTFPSEEWEYLSTSAGRWFAQFFFNMMKNKPTANATGARNLCMTGLANDVLVKLADPTLIVEIGTLLNPRGLKLAQKYPNAQVIEIGVPQIIDVKVERIGRLLNGAIPPNLSFYKADVRKQPLRDILTEQTADLVIAEGVLPFCTPEMISQISTSVKDCLKPAGVFLADVISSTGWKNVQGLNMMATITLSRQMGQFKGQFKNPADLRVLFETAGYQVVEVLEQESLARKYLPDTVTANTSFFVKAHKSV